MGDARFRLLICGSREWTDAPMIKTKLLSLRQELADWSIEVIHGGARGADILAGREASELGFSVTVFQADWQLHGKAAGPIRNQRMLDEGRPHEVWAFTHDLGRSRGTADMVRRAQRAGVRVRVFGPS